MDLDKAIICVTLKNQQGQRMESRIRYRMDSASLYPSWWIWKAVHTLGPSGRRIRPPELSPLEVDSLDLEIDGRVVASMDSPEDKQLLNAALNEALALGGDCIFVPFAVIAIHLAITKLGMESPAVGETELEGYAWYMKCRGLRESARILTDIASRTQRKSIYSACLVAAREIVRIRQEQKKMRIERMRSYSPPDTLESIRQAVIEGKVPDLNRLFLNLLTARIANPHHISNLRNTRLVWNPETNTMRIVAAKSGSIPDGHLNVFVQREVPPGWREITESWIDFIDDVVVTDGTCSVYFTIHHSKDPAFVYASRIKIYALEDNMVHMLSLTREHYGLNCNLYRRRAPRKSHEQRRFLNLIGQADNATGRGEYIYNSTWTIRNAVVPSIVYKPPSLTDELNRYLSLLPIRSHGVTISTPEDLLLALLSISIPTIDFSGKLEVARRLVYHNADTLLQMSIHSVTLLTIRNALMRLILDLYPPPSERNVIWGCDEEETHRRTGDNRERELYMKILTHLLGNDGRVSLFVSTLPAILQEKDMRFWPHLSDSVVRMVSGSDRLNAMNTILSQSILTTMMNAMASLAHIGGDE